MDDETLDNFVHALIINYQLKKEVLFKINAQDYTKVKHKVATLLECLSQKEKIDLNKLLLIILKTKNPSSCSKPIGDLIDSINKLTIKVKAKTNNYHSL